MYNRTWYNSLRKAPLSPPDWVFGTVWPILYTLLTISLLLVWTDKKCVPYCKPLTFFFIQLAFNLSWTTVFFRYKKTKLSLFITILIIGFTLYTYTQFNPINKTASYLLIPYLLWLLFATYLNGYIVVNN